MAHGYISANGTLEVEDVGEQIWNELIVRSLFEKVINARGKTLMDTVIMHDLVHDLAHSIMENKVPGVRLDRISTSASNSTIRQVHLSNRYVSFPKSIQLDMDMDLILKYHNLRVLDASTSQEFTWLSSRSRRLSGIRKESIKELPSTISNLNHLRLLNLSGSDIRILPSSLCSLWNMQVLNLTHCRKLAGFPENMRYLKNLRHLRLSFCSSLNETPFRVGELTHLKTLEKFIVGSNKGNQLQELECLNLGGHLEILHLERVENPTDAKKATLDEKHNLHQLCLAWEVDVAFTLRGDTDEKVLEALQPHPNIECFTISGLSGRHFPNWMMTMVKLVQVEIIDCQNLMDLLQLEELPHLKSLYLKKIAAEYIVQGGNALSPKFPSVEILVLSSLPNLKGFFKGEAGEMFPNLLKLNVSDCPSLVLLAQLSKLEKLEKWVCDDSLCLSSVPKLVSLKSITCTLGRNMTCIPRQSLECLANLKTLYIHHAHEQYLPTDGLQGLKSLQKLAIWRSETVTCLPGGWFCHNTTLKQLRIWNCREFIELPEEIRYLEALTEITLSMLPKMLCIPEAIRHLSSLDTLRLWDLPELTSLPDWLGNLTTLCSLHIRGCPKLASLPWCIQGMPSLQSLRIACCPNLVRRCEEGRGEDWHKISHIPKLDIRP